MGAWQEWSAHLTRWIGGFSMGWPILIHLLSCHTPLEEAFRRPPSPCSQTVLPTYLSLSQCLSALQIIHSVPCSLYLATWGLGNHINKPPNLLPEGSAPGGSFLCILSTHHSKTHAWMLTCDSPKLSNPSWLLDLMDYCRTENWTESRSYSWQTNTLSTRSEAADWSCLLP